MTGRRSWGPGRACASRAQLSVSLLLTGGFSLTFRVGDFLSAVARTSLFNYSELQADISISTIL